MTRRDPLANAHAYFEALQRFDLEATADCFTDDVFYSHPPYSQEPGALRHEARGRAELIALLQLRGPKQVEHEILSCATAGDRAFIEGTFKSGDAIGSFVSVIELADDGRFASYAAYASVPAVGDAHAHAPVSGQRGQ